LGKATEKHSGAAMKKHLGAILAGFCCGIINGLFGGGGGMILVPMLTLLTDLNDREVFPASISIILPMCILSLSISAMEQPLCWTTALPYLIGSALGGILAGLLGKRIPTVWLHRGLGILILWGGYRYLC
jgi:uncharacterized membrane protein YfcA